METPIDPVTGQPYSFWGGSTVNPDENPWALQGQYQFQGDHDRDSGQTRDMYGYFDRPDYSPEWTKSLGYGGSPEGFENWARTQGLTLGMGQTNGGGEAGQDLLRLQAFQGGNPFGGEHNWTKEENDPAFAAGLAGMAAFMGNFAMAGGAGGLSGMNTGTLPGEFGELGYGAGAAASGSGVSPVLGGEFGELGYGAGASAGSSPSWMTQLQNGDVAGALKTGGSGLLDWAKANPGTALKLLGTVGGGLLGGMGSGGSGGGKSYTPKMLGGTFNPSATAQYQPVQHQTGLLSPSQGNKSSGLWQFMSGPQKQSVPPPPPSLWSA